MPTHKILVGHNLRTLRNLKDGSVQLICTSPPYWGQRWYKTEPQIWGGKADCEHDWQEVHPAGFRSSDTNPGGLQHEGNQNRQNLISWRCSGCQAWRGELGLEDTAEEFVQHLVEIFTECRRVLRPDGCMFVNMGDAYASEPSKGGSGTPNGRNGRGEDYQRGGLSGCKPLDLVGVPWLLAFALRNDGWYLRSENIWHKVNPLPGSMNGWRWEKHRVKVDSKRKGTQGSVVGIGDGRRDHSGESRRCENQDTVYQICPGCEKCSPNNGLFLAKGSWRTTTAHEQVFMLTKTDDYFCDKEAVTTPSKEEKLGGTANLRSVWTMNTGGGGAISVQDEKGHEELQHWAAYPEELPDICIKSATSEKGCCPDCGSPWVRVIERTDKGFADRTFRSIHDVETPGMTNGVGETTLAKVIEIKTVGWKPSCVCPEKPPVPCVVLDPFGGTGSTSMAADKLGRNSILCELNPKSARMAELRLSRDNPMFSKVEVVNKREAC